MSMDMGMLAGGHIRDTDTVPEIRTADSDLT